MKTILLFLLLLSHYCFAQSPKPFKTCSKTVGYTVDDWELRKMVGMDLILPLSNPKFGGGVAVLEKYFKANSLPSSNPFRTFICFVVNCKGEVGNFQVMGDTQGDYVRQVLEIVKKMPRIWKPALSKEGIAVDSYQVLYLTLYEGKFVDVAYK